MFDHLELCASEPSMGLVDAFMRDNRESKVNLGLETHCDDDGLGSRLHSIDLAAAKLLKQPRSNRYLPAAGDEEFRSGALRLLLGSANGPRMEASTATVQTLGGSGALRVGAEFLKQSFPRSNVWLSDPSWCNHQAIFTGAGFAVHRYRYLDRVKRELDFGGMVEDLKALPARSIVVLQPSCHNPTGVDPSEMQWDEICYVIASRQLIPFLDVAYQGLGRGLRQDAYLLTALRSANISFLIAASFSKIFSLYEERCGALSIVNYAPDLKERILGQLQGIIRKSYFSPPSRGAQLISKILHSDNLLAAWDKELSEVRNRLTKNRHLLYEAVSVASPEEEFDFLLKHRGMFSHTGFSHRRLLELRRQYGVYLSENGRMCVAGLHRDNIPWIAAAFAKTSTYDS